MFGDEPSPDEVIKHFIGRPSANIEMDTVLPRHLSTTTTRSYRWRDDCASDAKAAESNVDIGNFKRRHDANYKAGP